MIFSKIVCKPQNFGRNCTGLVGKFLSSPHSLTVEDLKNILWTAIELRQVLKRKNAKLDVIKGAKVLFVMKEPSMYLEVPAIKASEMLSVQLNVIVDPHWDSVGFMSDTLKYLEINADLVIAQCRFQCNLDSAEDTKVPLFAMQSLRFQMLQSLADIMTMQIKYKYLRKLKVAWIGPPNRLLNTYLVIGSKIGMNISYCCSFNTNTLQSPASLEAAQKVCLSTHSQLQECNNLQSTIEGANVIAASSHGTNDAVISLDILNLAGKDSCVIFGLPRGLNKIEKALVANETRCLTWDSVHNMKWIMAAVMIRLLSHYEPVIDMPKF